MKKNVCMFVWNHFTNDARVLRECTTLSEKGYNVDLICIHDPNNLDMKYVEKRNDHFNVYRVRRYPLLFSAFQKCLKNKFLGSLAFGFWLFLAYFFPLIIIPITLLVGIVLKTKLKQVIIRSNIIIRMILRGRLKRYDIYHSNDLNTLPQGYICSKWRFKRRALIYDSHEVQTSRTGYDHSIYAKLEQFFINKMDSMIVENHTRAKYNEVLYGFYPNVIHNYPFKQNKIKVDDEKINLNKILQLSEDEKILLYQGGIQEGRGLDKLIKAVPMFEQGTLVLIGDGRIKPDLEKMVKDMNLQDRVKFLPKVPLEDLPKYTENAYIGFQVLNNINYNHYSASSNKLFEYMMAGVPVVACNFPEIRRVVQGEETGICIDSHKPEEIANAVNKLLNNSALHTRYSENSIKASKLFNWDQEKELFINVYAEVS